MVNRIGYAMMFHYLDNILYWPCWRSRPAYKLCFGRLYLFQLLQKVWYFLHTPIPWLIGLFMHWCPLTWIRYWPCWRSSLAYTLCFGRLYSESAYFTVKGQSYFSRLPKYWPPIPLSAQRVCPPPATHSLGGEGDGGSIIWKTREIGLPSYSKICTLWLYLFQLLQKVWYFLHITIPWLIRLVMQWCPLTWIRYWPCWRSRLAYTLCLVQSSFPLPLLPAFLAYTVQAPQKVYQHFI